MPTSASTNRAWHLLALAGLALLVAMVYLPGLSGGFVFDDYPNIVNNTSLHVNQGAQWPAWLAATFSSPASDLQRPLAMFTFALNHAFSGLDPYWMKATNLAIHLLNTLLVFKLVQLLLVAARDHHSNSNSGNASASASNDRIAMWVAAAWALHPINLMAVLFVVQRMESLSHTFVFAGLCLYLTARSRLLRDGRGWTMLITGLVAGTMLGTLSKESAVLMPLYSLAIEWTLLNFASAGRPRDPRLLGLYGITLALPAAIGLMWLIPGILSGGAYAGRSFSLTERLMTEARVVTDYLHWTLLPDLGQLSLYHDDYQVSRGMLSPPTTILAVLIITAIVAASVWLRARRPLMALGLAWFLAAHLLTATIIPLELVYEHRNYFASLGLCLVLADGLLMAPRQQPMRRAGVAAAVLLLLFHAGVTTLRAREWSDPLRFSLTEAAKHPQSPRATYDLARNLVILSGYRPDSPYTARAFEALSQAMAAPNATPLPESAALILSSRSGLPAQRTWWKTLQDKLRTGPIGPQENAALAALDDCQTRHLCSFPPQDMVDTFVAAMERHPNAEVLSIYGNYALNTLHDPNLAYRLWREAALQAPSIAEYQVSLAKLLIAGGRPDLAMPHIARVRQLGRWGQNEMLARNLEHLALQVPTSPSNQGR